MKLSETIDDLYKDIAKCGENEVVEIKFSHATWRIEVKSFIKILQLAYAYITKKA